MRELMQKIFAKFRGDDATEVIGFVGVLVALLGIMAVGKWVMPVPKGQRAAPITASAGWAAIPGRPTPAADGIVETIELEVESVFLTANRKAAAAK